MRFLFLFLICSSLSLSNFFSQENNFSFEFYTKSYSLDHFDASPQVFDIDQDNRGVMYFANQNGFIEYDGSQWRNISLFPQTEINSIEKDSEGIIFAGGIEEFGYLDVLDKGQTIYKSLVPLITDTNVVKDFKRVINIKINSKDKVFFQSYKYIFIYDRKVNKDKLQIIKTSENNHFHESFIFDNDFYVTVKGEGLKKYQNNNLILLKNGEDFSDKRIFGIEKFKDRDLIISQKDGVYSINNNKKIEKIADLNLNANTYSSININNQFLSIGTFGNGVFLLDEDFRVHYKIDQKSGLLDAVVNCQFMDAEGNLWIGTNNGITKVLINSPISLLNLKENKLSTIESVIEFEDKLFLSTLNSVYFSEINNFQKGFNELEGINVDCYGLLVYPTKIDTFLLIAAVDAVISYSKKSGIKKLANMSPYQMMIDYSDSNRIVICNYTGLSSITWDGEKFIDNGFVPGFNEDIYNFKYDSLGNLYLGSKKKGLYLTNHRIFDDHTIPIKNISKEIGIPVGHSFIELVDDRIVIGTNSGLYVKDSNGWEKSNSFGYDKLLNYGIHRIKKLANGDVWMVLYDDKNNYDFEVGCSRKINGKYIWNSDDFKNYSDELIHAIYDDGDNIWFGGVNYLYHYDPSFKKKSKTSFNTLIRNIKWGSDTIFHGGYSNFQDSIKASLVYNKPIVLSFSNKRIEFQYSSSSYLNEDKNEFSYMLEGYGDHWSEWEREPKCDFTNLPEGTYKFRVKSRNYLGDIGKETIFEFTVLPPWYRTIWAYAIYFSLFLLLIYLGVKLGTIRIQKQKQLLEKVVKDRTQEVILQKNEIEGQREELQELYNDVTDSIRYAKRLQDSILPPDQFIKDLFPDSFVYYRPKDIVSGDFYWAHQSEGKNMIAAVDCTGHGVPGAFMSLVGANGLNAAVQEQKKISPARILNDLNSFSYLALNKDFEGETVRDGMDMTIICLDPKKKKLSFSGASNPIYKVSDGELEILKGDRFAIGSFVPGEKEFSELEVSVKKNDMIYLFSDGYPDQFGGLKGKKFMGRNFRALLIEVSKEDTQKQQEIIHQRMEAWRGEHEQIDDILVIGIRIS